MKLYLTLEAGDLKAERTMMIDQDTASDHNILGEAIEDMYDLLHGMVRRKDLGLDIDLAADDEALKKSVPLPEGVEPNEPF